MRENKWPKLGLLNTKTTSVPEGFSENLAKVLQGGAGSNLEIIEVACDSFYSMQEVGRVLHQGACPKLRYLYIGVKGADLADSSEDEHIPLKEEEDAYSEELSAWLDERGIGLSYYYFESQGSH